MPRSHKPDLELVPEGFDSPTRLPQDEEQRQQWQAANKTWWENNPMRYDWEDNRINADQFSKEFYLATDHLFFSGAKRAIGWRTLPFDRLIDFEELRDRDVLEIGVGRGSHAQLLANHAKSYTGIDITDYAVKSTSERMKCFGIPHARILHMDAEDMDFPDGTFDYIWSWGVIHHSADTEKILREIRRVLRPGGKAVTMVYHRGWNYYVRNGLVRGIIRGQLLKTKSLHAIAQTHIDGAIARHYSIDEWRTLTSKHFNVKDVQIFGTKVELVMLPGTTLKRLAMPLFPDPLSRFLTHRCKLGGFLVSSLERP